MLDQNTCTTGTDRLSSLNGDELKKLLIIDDEPSIREILSIALEDDWNVLLAESGTLGLEIAARERPDLILLDRMMPGLDGLSTLKALRADSETNQIPVIFLTAKVQVSDMKDYENENILGVLSKPFDPMTISDVLTELVRGASPQTEKR